MSMAYLAQPGQQQQLEWLDGGTHGSAHERIRGHRGQQRPDHAAYAIVVHAAQAVIGTRRGARARQDTNRDRHTPAHCVVEPDGVIDRNGVVEPDGGSQPNPEPASDTGRRFQRGADHDGASDPVPHRHDRNHT